MIVVTVARRPLSGSVAETVLARGAGALNIDASRVAPVEGEVVGPGSWSDPARRAGEVGSDMGFSGNDVARFQQAQAESVERANRLGRWPANLVLGHQAGCRPEGTGKVKNQGGVPKATSVSDTAVRFLGKKRTGFTHYFDEDGLETVTTWACVEGCPVAALDAQTGDLQPSKGAYVRKHGDEQFLGSGLGDGRVDEPTGVSDAGGASRFFKQVRG